MKWQIGDRIRCLFSFSQEDVDTFAKLSGDCQAIHVNQERAKDTIFGARIVHGVLMLAKLSMMLGMMVPQSKEYAIFVEIDKGRFLKPVYIEEQVVLELILRDQIKNRLVFSVVWYKVNVGIAMTAEATIVLKDYRSWQKDG